MSAVVAPATAPAAFRALLLRDLAVLGKNLRQFVPRMVMQPFLFVFVFAYVFPKIGQAVGGSPVEASRFSTLLVAGVVALTIVMQGVLGVAVPMVEEFGYTREIEDRVLAPLPVAWVALEKVAAGALYGLFASLVVFPLAAVVPATPVYLDVNWPVLLTVGPLACLCAGALGLAFGTRFEPRSVPVLYMIVVIPMIFLGAIYYPWARLGPIAWLKWLVLVNPMVYMSEGFRAALTDGVPHMPLPGVYAGLVVFTVGLTVLGIKGFHRRVVA